ncbi:MAG: FeoA family protein [Eubacteriales bacterium]|nr:FeoA family protein [Eubacteriales bacterium]MDD4444188.1 FeoA family protein [Eubacteriales bacterium]
MIPLTLLNCGELGEVQKVIGNDAVRQHLANMGLVVGETVAVVCRMDENLVLAVNKSRIALNHEMAKGIMVHGGITNENTQRNYGRKYRHGPAHPWRRGSKTSDHGNGHY